MIWTAAAATLAVMWLILALRCSLAMRSMPDLARGPRPPDEGLPSLTVVFAARNEERAIGPCLESLLAQDCPGLKIVCVNDRSTDATGRIADELAAAHPGRLSVLHIAELPPGWLGKCHALWRGSQGITSEFILFTDADVVFQPDALLRALSHTRREEADMLCMIPNLVAPSRWERVFMIGFSVIFLASVPPHAAQRDRSRIYMGSGSFNLVRREIYERGGGHAALRLAVVDDLMLGRLIKRAGGRLRAARGHDLIAVRWQTSLMGHILGLEKNMFASLNFSVLRASAAAISLMIFNLGPLVCLAAGPLQARLLGAATWFVVMPLITVLAGRSVPRVAALGPLMPLGGVLMSVAILNSMWKTLRRGGIRWRDTFHSLKELREYQRRMN